MKQSNLSYGSLPEAYCNGEHNFSTMKFIPKKEKLFSRATFIFLGISSLFTWNTYLCCSAVLHGTLFPSTGFIRHVQTSYMTAVLFGNFFMVIGFTKYFDPYSSSIHFNYIAAVLAFFVSVSIGYFAKTMIGCWINVIVACLVALSCAVLIPEAFTLAAIMPESFCSDVSFGQGLSGILAFLLAAFFDLILPKTYGGRKALVQILFCISCVISVISGLMTRYIFSFAWGKFAIEEVRRISLTTSSDSNLRLSFRSSDEIDTLDSFSQSSLHSSQVLKKIWQHLYNIFMSFFVTLAIFPAACVSWKTTVNSDYSNFGSILLIGIFQFGDIAGRYLPKFGILIPSSFLWIFTTARLLFIPIYSLLQNAPPDTFLGSLFTKCFVQLLMAISNGFFACLAFIYGPELVEDRREKERASFLLALYNVAGMTAGSWLMNVLVWFGVLKM